MADDITIPRPAAIEAIYALVTAADRAIEQADYEAAQALSAALAGICEGLIRS